MSFIAWESEDDDDVVRAVSIETSMQWEKLGAQRGLDVQFIFMNDASRDQDPLNSYGAENVGMLNEIALAYDPTRLFQQQQNDGFLLAKQY
jgi:hypothetical protein